MPNKGRPIFQTKARTEEPDGPTILRTARDFRKEINEAVQSGRWRLTRLTSFNKPPPCFTPHQYREWLRAGKSAAGAMPTKRHRDGFYTEPNYCYDCTGGYRDRMCREDRCIFPETTFGIKQSEGEKFIGGISHKIRWDDPRRPYSEIGKASGG